MIDQPLLQDAAACSGTLWLGFSGGLDSTVLLHLLVQQPELKPRIKAIHVHHGLSANAEAWLAHCQRVCDSLGVPLLAERVQLEHPTDGVEQAARNARYACYRRHCQAGDALLLAHHGDDQLETFFMRLVRGASLAGLAAMPARRVLKEGVWLYRPLLHRLRSELEHYAQAQQLQWIEDESNQDVRYQRNLWRTVLLPALWRFFPQPKQRVLSSIQQLRQDHLLLSELLAPEVEAVCQSWPWPNCAPIALSVEKLQNYPAHHWSYLVRAWLARLDLMLPSQRFIDALQGSVLSARADAQPQMTLGAWQLGRSQGALFLYQPFVGEERDIELSADAWSWGAGTVRAWPANEGLAAGRYRLCAAHQARGLSLQPANRPHKTLKALMQEAKIPAPLRENWPVLLREGQLCAVIGVAYSPSAGNNLLQTGYFSS